MEEAWRRKHGGGIMGGIEEEAFRRKHGGSMEEEAWRRMHGGEAPRRHPGGTQEASRRHPGGIQEAPRRHPGSPGDTRAVLRQNVPKTLCFSANPCATERFVSTKREQVSPSINIYTVWSSGPGRPAPTNPPTESLEKPPGTLRGKLCLGNICIYMYK